MTAVMNKITDPEGLNPAIIYSWKLASGKVFIFTAIDSHQAGIIEMFCKSEINEDADLDKLIDFLDSMGFKENKK